MKHEPRERVENVRNGDGRWVEWSRADRETVIASRLHTTSLRQLLVALTVSRPRSPPLPVIYPPPVSAAVPPSLKASSHGVNDGWRKRKETTHGESERETDERLDQDMRKDDEEPRAARE